MKNPDNASCNIIVPNNANAPYTFPFFFLFKALVTYALGIILSPISGIQDHKFTFYEG